MVANMDDGDLVAVKPMPAGGPIHQRRNDRLGSEHGPFDAVAAQHLIKHVAFCMHDRQVHIHEVIAVKIGAAVDEGADAIEDQQAAEAVLVQHRPGTQIGGHAGQGISRVTALIDAFQGHAQAEGQ